MKKSQPKSKILGLIQTVSSRKQNKSRKKANRSVIFSITSEFLTMTILHNTKATLCLNDWTMIKDLL